MRNVQDLLSDGKTPCVARFGEPFSGPVIPFGSMIEYHPISAKGESRLHQFGQKVPPGIFLGNDFFAGKASGKEISRLQPLKSWKNFDASEIRARRLDAKEVLMP